MMINRMLHADLPSGHGILQDCIPWRDADRWSGHHQFAPVLRHFPRYLPWSTATGRPPLPDRTGTISARGPLIPLVRQKAMVFNRFAQITQSAPPDQSSLRRKNNTPLPQNAKSASKAAVPKVVSLEAAGFFL